jgi:hypothetical protein
LLGKSGVESIWVRVFCGLNFWCGGVAVFEGGFVILGGFDVVNLWCECGELLVRAWRFAACF